MTATLRHARTGRPAMRWLDELEIAALARLKPALVRRHMACPRSPFFSHARQHPETKVWTAPETDVRLFLGSKVERMFTLEEAADMVSLDYKWFSELARRGVVPSRRILGRVRIAESDLNALPAELPPELRRSRAALQPPL